jgi:hypothetical protein
MQARKVNKIDTPQQLPFLESICWQADLVQLKRLAPLEMLRCYERGWRNLGVMSDPSEEEWAFIRALVEEYKSWLVSEL